MTSGTRYKQGDVVIVPFPFSDLSAIKRRPVLVLSNDGYNSRGEDIVICGITSNLRDAECSVLLGDEDLVEGSIPARSRIKADKLFTIEKSKVIKKVAAVSDGILEKVKAEMWELLAI